MSVHDIPALVDRVREIVTSPKNHQKEAFWVPARSGAKDHWRGMPRPYGDLGAAPFTVEPEVPLWGEIIGFDLPTFYTDPDYYLECTLRITIYRSEHFPDCTPVGKGIGIWLGTTLESSLFGAHTIYAPKASPWLDREATIRSERDLAALRMPDFYCGGLMPVAHRYYERIRELLPPDFTVTFPEWGRGPWGVAFHLRLLENLACDVMGNPTFVHRLLTFITEARKEWWRERAKFLGIPLEPANLYNDEVNCPTLSPGMYEEFVLPYEQELSAFHGGIGYWHSCGDTTRLLELIDRIPNLGMFHVGPWTDLGRVVEVYGGRHPLEICLDPVQDVQSATEAEMRHKLKAIRNMCGDTAYTVRADGLQNLHGVGREMEQIQRWLGVARESLTDLR